jgi:hypothetical protein
MYLPRKELCQEIANAIGKCGDNVFELPANRARLLLMKRAAFSHESEVRAVFVQQNAMPKTEFISVPFEPSHVFDDISLDPRLETFERRERETVIRSLGYKGEISEHGLYQGTLLQVVIGGEANPTATQTEPDSAV